jgi:hypothetical protein
MVNTLDYDVWRSHFGQVHMPPAAGSAMSSAASLPDAAESESNSTNDRGPTPSDVVDFKSGKKSASVSFFKQGAPTPAPSAAVDLLMALGSSRTVGNVPDESWLSPGDSGSPSSNTAIEEAWNELDSVPLGLAGGDFDVP